VPHKGNRAEKADRHRLQVEVTTACPALSADSLKWPENADTLTPEEAQCLIYNLKAHQIELEMQNEELRRALQELAKSRTCYVDFFNLAPVGIIHVSGKGLIIEVNLNFATMAGIPGGKLVKQPISRFIHKKDQDIYYSRRRQLSQTGNQQACELRMLHANGSHFWAQLQWTIISDDAGQGPSSYIMVSDITVRKHVESGRSVLIYSLNSTSRELNDFSYAASRKAWEQRNQVYESRLQQIQMQMPNQELNRTQL
jgi:PAS domain S-box-containing protein